MTPPEAGARLQQSPAGGCSSRELDRPSARNRSSKSAKTEEGACTAHATLEPRHLTGLGFVGLYHLFNIKHAYPIPGTAVAHDRHNQDAVKFRSGTELQAGGSCGGYPIQARCCHEERLEKTEPDGPGGVRSQRTRHHEADRAYVLRDGEEEGQGVPRGQHTKCFKGSARSVLQKPTGPGNSLSHAVLPCLTCASQADVEYEEFMSYVRSNDCYNVERMLRCGFEHVDLLDGNMGDTPLMVACAEGYAQVARLLLQGGACPNVMSDLGECAIHKVWNFWRREEETGSPVDAARRMQEREWSISMLKDLIAFGADVNYPTRDGRVALHGAAEHGPLEALRLLLMFRADEQARDSRGRRPIDIANKVMERSDDPRRRDIQKLLRAWPVIKKEIQAHEFKNGWRGFLRDPDMKLGGTPSIRDIMSIVSGEEEMNSLSKCDTVVDRYDNPMFTVVDEIVTGPVDVPLADASVPPQAKRTVIRIAKAEYAQAERRTCKIKPPVIPTSDKLQVPLDKFLLSEVKPDFVCRAKAKQPTQHLTGAEEQRTAPDSHVKLQWTTHESPDSGAPTKRPTSEKCSGGAAAGTCGLAQRLKTAAQALASDAVGHQALKRPALHSAVQAPVRLHAVQIDDEEGVHVVVVEEKQATHLDALGRPKTGAYLGQRLLARQEGKARHHAEKIHAEGRRHSSPEKAGAAVVGSTDGQSGQTVPFTEERDIVYKSAVRFSEADLMPCEGNVKRLVPLHGEKDGEFEGASLHASHPRAIEKRENVRAIATYTQYQDPWKNVTGSYVPTWS